MGGGRCLWLGKQRAISADFVVVNLSAWVFEREKKNTINIIANDQIKK